MFNLIVKVIFSSVLNTVTHITYMACFHFLQNVVRITHKTGFVLHAVESLRIKYFTCTCRVELSWKTYTLISFIDFFHVFFSTIGCLKSINIYMYMGFSKRILAHRSLLLFTENLLLYIGSACGALVLVLVVVISIILCHKRRWVF